RLGHAAGRQDPRRRHARSRRPDQRADGPLVACNNQLRTTRPPSVGWAESAKPNISSPRNVGLRRLSPTYREVGRAGVVRNIRRPTYGSKSDVTGHQPSISAKRIVTRTAGLAGGARRPQRLGSVAAFRGGAQGSGGLGHVVRFSVEICLAGPRAG